jgi:hypothetical protein
MSNPIIGRVRMITSARLPSRTLFFTSGASPYSTTSLMASRFLGQPEPATICLGRDWPSI